MCVHTLKHSVERRGEFPKLNIVVFVEKHRRDHRVNGRHQKEHNERVCNRQNRLQQRCMCCVYVLCVCVVCTCCVYVLCVCVVCMCCVYVLCVCVVCTCCVYVLCVRVVWSSPKTAKPTRLRLEESIAAAMYNKQ